MSRIQFYFQPYKFQDQRDLFSRPDSERLIFPNQEPMGVLTASTGESSVVEFIEANDELGTDEFLGPLYKGPGIYLIRYPGKDYFDFWVALRNGNEITGGDAKAILNKINRIMEDKEYETQSSWDLSI